MSTHGFELRKIDETKLITENKPRAYFICYSSKRVVLYFFNFIYKDVKENILYSRKKKIFTNNMKLLEYKNK